MVDIQCAAAEIRRGKKEDRWKIERNHRMKILWSAPFHRATITSKQRQTKTEVSTSYRHVASNPSTLAMVIKDA